MSRKMDRIGDELHWLKLCDEYDAAREAHLQALSSVKKKLDEFRKGASSSQPETHEFSEFQKSLHTWSDVMKRMDEFMKKNK